MQWALCLFKFSLNSCVCRAYFVYEVNDGEAYASPHGLPSYLNVVMPSRGEMTQVVRGVEVIRKQTFFNEKLIGHLDLISKLAAKVG